MDALGGWIVGSDVHMAAETVSADFVVTAVASVGLSTGHVRWSSGLTGGIVRAREFGRSGVTPGSHISDV